MLWRSASLRAWELHQTWWRKTLRLLSFRHLIGPDPPHLFRRLANQSGGALCTLTANTETEREIDGGVLNCIPQFSTSKHTSGSCSVTDFSPLLWSCYSFCHGPVSCLQSECFRLDCKSNCSPVSRCSAVSKRGEDFCLLTAYAVRNTEYKPVRVD